MIRKIPSQTALRVALCLITLSAREKTRRLLPDGIGDATAKLLVASGMADPALIRIVRRPGTVRLSMALNPWMSGQFQAFAYRKAFCEQAVLEAIKKGASQVLVLGAGFDTLCWRLASLHPNIKFLEIDYPATSEAKMKGIGKMGQPANMQMIAADLSQQSLQQVLAGEPSWHREQPSVIVAEGLLMYLRPADVLSVFKQTAASVGADSRFAFSHFYARRNGRANLGLFGDYALAGLRLLGEPVRWAIRKEKLPDFLEGTGWQPGAGSEQPHPDRAGIEGYVLLQRV
jgi:methyltransferase (TIGR00027 family)